MCWKRWCVSSPSSTRRTRCFWESVVSSVLTRGDTSGGVSAETAASAKTYPTTDAGSITERSTLARVSRRAARSAWIVGGTWRSDSGPVVCQVPFVRSITPSSTSIRRSCSANSGLPSAAVTTWSSTSGSSDPPPSMLSTIARLASAPSGSRSIRVERAPTHQSGFSSTSSGRAGQTTRTGASSIAWTSCSIISRSVGSAQCTSSTTSATGRSVATCSRNRRIPHASSSIGNGSVLRPIIAASRSVTSVPAGSVSAESFARASSASSSLTMPEAFFSASASGQNVMPSP